MPRTEKTPAYLAAQESLTHEQLIEGVRPSIEAIRREIFSDPDVPFPTHAKAVAWIKQAPAMKRIALKRMRELVRKVREETGGHGHVSFQTPTVAYWEPGSRTVIHVGAAEGSGHASLGYRAKEIANATGWHAAEVVMWTLADVKPDPVPRLRFRVNERFSGSVFPDGRQLHRKTVILEVYDPSFSDAEWRRVLKSVRKEFRRGRKWSLSKRDHILSDVVHELGDTPAPGETWTAHWEAVADECNHRAGDPTWFSGCRGPYMRWGRLKKRLSDVQTVFVTPGGPQPFPGALKEQHP